MLQERKTDPFFQSKCKKREGNGFLSQGEREVELDQYDEEDFVC